MPFNLPVSIPDSGYKIARSLRFNPADIAYLTRTPVVAGNRQKFTLSGWVKRSGISSGNPTVFSSGPADSSNQFHVYFTPADTITVFCHHTSTTQLNQITAAAYRDPSAWMHIVVAIDTTNAVAADRCKLYINNVQQVFAGGGTLFALNTQTSMNAVFPHAIGEMTSGSNYFSGYMGDCYLVDGLALDPSAFGATDLTTGVWMPKAYTGLYGVNGYKLDFADNSATTAATLGKDRSGMSNLFPYSDLFTNVAWAQGGTITGGQSDPLGGTGAFSVVVAGGAAQPYVATPFTYAAGQTTTLTVYAKAGAVNLLGIYGGINNGGFASFDLTPGAGVVTNAYASGTGSGASAKIENAGGDWWKCSLTVTHNTAGVDTNYIQSTSSTTTNGQGIVIFRASLVNGATVPAELQYTAGTAVADKNWTPNAFSVTAGVGDDSLVDTPTNYGIDAAGAGGAVRGNYCTINPLDNAGQTLSNGNLQGYSPSAVWRSARGTMGVSSGKWYFEVIYSGLTGPFAMVGVGDATGNIGTTFGAGAPGYWLYFPTGTKYVPSGAGLAYGAAWTNGSVIGVLLDMDAGTLTMKKDNVSQGVLQSGLTGTLFPWLSMFDNASIANVNFGQRAFTYPQAGFNAWCTQNLPDPAITWGKDYFDTLLHTGNSTTSKVVGGGRFRPDLVWIKNRQVAFNHTLTDTARGGSLYLESNNTSQELAAAIVSSFNADGFTIGTASGQVNGANDYVDWVWKKGVVAGFDIVPFTAAASGAMAVPHTLGVKPAMVIVKTRGATSSWVIWHQSFVNHIDHILTFTTIVTTTSAGAWGAGMTNLKLGFLSGASVIASQTCVAYAFADVPGFSKFGSYIGNGAVDGQFVFTGFRPRFVLLKRVNVAASWVMLDAARSLNNPISVYMIADGTAVDTAGPPVDFVSNGFKFRDGTAGFNGSGDTHFYAAFAENPFKYARAR